MTKYTFTRPLTHSEIVALAIRNWPMPCGISIVKPPEDQHDLLRTISGIEILYEIFNCPFPSCPIELKGIAV